MLLLSKIIREAINQNRRDYFASCDFTLKLNITEPTSSDESSKVDFAEKTIIIEQATTFRDFAHHFGAFMNDVRFEVENNVSSHDFQNIVSTCFTLLQPKQLHVFSKNHDLRKLPMGELICEQMSELSMEGVVFQSEHDLNYHFPNIKILEVTRVSADTENFFKCELPNLTDLTIGRQDDDNIYKLYELALSNLTNLRLAFYQKKCLDVLALIRKLKCGQGMDFGLQILLEETNWSSCQFAFLLGLCEDFEECMVEVVPKPEDNKIIDDLKELLGSSWLLPDDDVEVGCKFEKIGKEL